MKSIVYYDNYRILLRDYIEDRKSSPGFNKKKFLKDCGLQSNSHFNMILAGSRKLRSAGIIPMAIALGLIDLEMDFFFYLVHCNQSDNLHSRSFFEAKLNQIKGDLSVSSPPSSQLPMIFEKWYYPLILVASDGHNHEHAFSNVSKKIKITKNEFNRILEKMQETGLIQITDGLIQQNVNYMKFQDKNLLKVSYKKYLKEQLRRSESILNQLEQKSNRFLSHTLGISADRKKSLLIEIEQYFAKLIAQSSKDKVEDILQINVQVF